MKRPRLRSGSTVAFALLASLAFGLARATAGCGGGGGDEGLATVDGATESEGGNGEGGSSGPSFCNGIVLYANLDQGFAPQIGSATAYPYGNVAASSDGKFGGSVALFRDAGETNEAGANLYYLPTDGGPPVFPDDVGTVSLWYKGTAIVDTVGPPVSGSPVLYRPVATIAPKPVVGSGLALTGFSQQFGLFNTPPDASAEGVLVFSKIEVRRFMKADAPNHFVAAWQKGDGGAVPTAVLAINGGLGVVLDGSDAGVDYSHATIDDAGVFPVPYRGYATTPWDNPVPTIAFRLGGTSVSAPEGEIDDVAVWSRVLTWDEIAAIYQAGAPIGQLCPRP
jgi:hypothetical protein